MSTCWPGWPACASVTNSNQNEAAFLNQFPHGRSNRVTSEAHRIKILVLKREQVLGYLTSQLTCDTIEEAEEFHIPKDQSKIKRFEMHLVKANLHQSQIVHVVAKQFLTGASVRWRQIRVFYQVVCQVSVLRPRYFHLYHLTQSIPVTGPKSPPIRDSALRLCLVSRTNHFVLIFSQ